MFRLAGGPVAAVLSDRTRERALERMRADFVANASHELRTPLASLIGFIDTLRGPAADDPPAQARFLQIMSEQASRMNRLIDDLLSLSRIELTEHQTPTGAVAVDELLRFTAAAFEPRVVRRGITLALDVPDGLPLVSGDDDQLEQVFQNLMDNAVKYGREGGTVRVSAAAGAAGRALAGAARPGGRHRRRRRRDRARAPAAADGAVLPRGQGPLPRGGRHRAGARHREAHRQPPPRPARDRQPGGRGCDLQRLAADGHRALKPPSRQWDSLRQ